MEEIKSVVEVVGCFSGRYWREGGSLSLYIYHRFIIRLTIGLDFPFINIFLHFFLSWTSSLPISWSAIFASTLSKHVLGLLTGLLPSILYSIHFFIKSLVLITCPYHLSLPLLMTVVVVSNQLSQFFTCPVFHGNVTHPSNHLHLCSFTLHPTSASKGLLSLP